jgi:hypothetical protein
MCQQSGVVSHWGTWDKGKASGHEEHTQGWVFGIEKRDTEGPLASQGLRGCKVQKEGYKCKRSVKFSTELDTMCFF